MPQSDLDELTGRTTDGVSRGARYLGVFTTIKEAIVAGDREGERAGFTCLDQIWSEMTEEERWEVARPTSLKFAELSQTYARSAAGLPTPAIGTGTRMDPEAKIDVRRVVRLTESVADAFKNYVDGSGHDAQLLAAAVPALLDSHVHLEALRRAGYGVEEICRLDAEIDKLRAALAKAQLSTETQASISAWAEKTFGPAGSNARAIARANREMAELLEHVTSDDQHPEAAEEIADIVIVLSRVMTRLNVDLQAEIDRKMAKNRARKWRLDGTGHGYHVKEPEEKDR